MAQVNDIQMDVEENNQLIDTSSFRYVLYQPLDLVLMQKFFNGQFLNPSRALEVYDSEIKPQKRGFEEDEPGYKVKCVQCRNNPGKNICNCHKKIYENQRILNNSDGLIYRLGKNRGQTKIKYKLKEGGEEYTKTESKIQMLVCVTMYNEDQDMLERTLGGIQENLPEFEKKGISSEQIAVVVIQDGITKTNEEVSQNIYGDIDKYLDLDDLEKRIQDSTQISKIKDEYKEQGLDRDIIQTRTFSKRKQLIEDQIKSFEKNGRGESIKKNQNFPISIQKNVAQVYQCQQDFIKEKDVPKLNVFYCNKHLNGRKLSSHMWFFQGFCRYLQPKYITLLDVGTQPDKMGIVNYFLALESDPTIGGVSGFMGLYFNNILGENDKTWRQKFGENSVSHKFTKTFCQTQGSQDDKAYQKAEKKRQIKYQQDKEENNKKKAEIKQKRLDQLKELERNEDQNQQEIKKIKQQIKDDEQEEQLLKAQEEEEKKQLREKNAIKGPITCIYVLFGLLAQCINSIVCKLHLFFDVRRAQVAEYTMAHILDKNFESFFNFLNVLPGAWSAYRFKALTKAQDYRMDILESRYLITALNPDNKDIENSIEASNMYLAEDRLLCLATFSQAGEKFILKYIPTARAKTDAIDNNIEFAGQRRRWINSSFFAQNYVIRNYSNHMKDSTHNSLRKGVGIPFQMFMSRLNQVNTYLIIGFYSFMIYACATQLFIPLIQKYELSSALEILPGGLMMVYVLLVILLVFLSLNYKWDTNSTNYKLYNFVSGMFGIYNFILTLMVIFTLLCKYAFEVDWMENQELEGQTKQDAEDEKDLIQLLVLYMAFVGFGSIFLIVAVQVMAGKHGIRLIMELLFCQLSYLYYSATYTHTLVIFAFCNIDDFSWGTKGSTESEGQSFVDKKNEFVALWMFSNCLLCYLLVFLNELFGDRGYVLIALGTYGVAIIGFKFIFAMLHHLYFYCIKQCTYTHISAERKILYQVLSNKVKKIVGENLIKDYKMDKQKIQIKNEKQRVNAQSVIHYSKIIQKK